MSVTQKKAIQYYRNLYDQGAVYVWGMNAPTVIDKTIIDKTFKMYGSDKYNRDYYDYKLKTGKGKIGSDCSGAHYGLSGYDTTAQGYYERCTKKGAIATLPKDKVVLLFASPSEKDGKTTYGHTGVYLGDGTCFHMASSTRNAVIEDVSVRGWVAWGYADFINDYKTYSVPPKQIVLQEYTQKDFIKDVCAILNVKSAKKALAKTVTISRTKNNSHTLVTPLERYLKALGYYSGAIEVDSRKPPCFGAGMESAVKLYQKKNVAGLASCPDGIITAKNKTWKTLLGLI